MTASPFPSQRNMAAGSRLEQFHIICRPLILRPERCHKHRDGNVRERPTVALHKGPLFDIHGSVLAVGKREPATVHRNSETDLDPSRVVSIQCHSCPSARTF
jgi:hypothetical protein